VRPRRGSAPRRAAEAMAAATASSADAPAARPAGAASPADAAAAGSPPRETAAPQFGGAAERRSGDHDSDGDDADERPPHGEAPSPPGRTALVAELRESADRVVSGQHLLPAHARAVEGVSWMSGFEGSLPYPTICRPVLCVSVFFVAGCR
jgi:hypothetical protein